MKRVYWLARWRWSWRCRIQSERQRRKPSYECPRVCPVARLPVSVVALDIAPGVRSLRHGAVQPKGQTITVDNLPPAPSCPDPDNPPTAGTPSFFLYAWHNALLTLLSGSALTPCPKKSSPESAKALTSALKRRESVTGERDNPLPSVVGAPEVVGL
jgi:hypothetical protein